MSENDLPRILFIFLSLITGALSGALASAFVLCHRQDLRPNLAPVKSRVFKRSSKWDNIFAEDLFWESGKERLAG